jgi:hypothetical protein
MQYPDLHHLARDRIIAAGVMKLDMHEAELSAARGEPGVVETRKPRQAASNPAKRALACASRRSPTLGRVPLVAPVSRTRTAALRRGRQTPEDAALYRCHCGKSFTAAVTTCVTCPDCGAGQAW